MPVFVYRTNRFLYSLTLLKLRAKGYQLQIKGLNRMVVLNSYSSVLSEGKLIQLKSEDCKRLSDLKAVA